jgi:hypothetical protein
MNEWCGLRVDPYAVRKEVESSSDTDPMFCAKAIAVKSSPLFAKDTLVWLDYEERRGIRTEQARLDPLWQYASSSSTH